MRKFHSTRRFGIWCDDLMGYHKPDYTRKWWLDLDLVNNRFVKPGKSGFARKPRKN